MNEVQITTTA